MLTHENSTPIPKLIAAAVSALILSASAGVLAEGEHSGGRGHGEASGGHDKGHGHGGGANIGEPGKASEVNRTITITLTDDLFSLENIDVRKGETIRFALQNKGDSVHEFNIGTAKMHEAHQKEMMLMVERGVLEPDKINYAQMKMDMGGGKTMEHNDPNSVLLEPKKSGEIVWKFNSDATLEFACNIPGHYESGMVGNISIH